MSSGYSANQYDSAFIPHRLQNWCEPKHFKERPTAHLGHTTFIADNRGHLLPGVGRRGPAWPNYKGTWDLPAHTPVRQINPTARSVEGLKRLKSWGMYPEHTDVSQPHRGTKSTNRLQTSGNVLEDGATPSAAAEAYTASQNRPTTGTERTTDQSQAGSQAAEQATERDRLLTQCSAAEAEDSFDAYCWGGNPQQP